MNNEILTRNKLQEQAMQLMYSYLIYEDLNKEIDVTESMSSFLDVPFDDVPLFLKLLLVKALKYEKETIDYVSKFLNNWKFNRLNYCIQSILILSVTNFKYLNDTDRAVIINVAIKLAKKYGDKNDYKFVNAVLDKCLDDSIRE